MQISIVLFHYTELSNSYIIDASTKENKVKEFTATQLKQELGSVMNAAQSDGEVRIVSRSRPDMFLMTWEGIAELINKTASSVRKENNDS